MARMCAKCGSEIPEGAAFCVECGTKAPEPEAVPEVSAEPAAPVFPPVSQAREPMQPARQAQPMQQAQPLQSAQPVQPVQPAQPARPVQPPQPVRYPPQTQAVPTRQYSPEGSQKPVSTLAFLGLKLLYALPVVGFFASLIFAIAPENRSLKHHALATFILRIVILGLLIFGGIRLWNNFDAVWEQITESVQVMTGDDDIESRDEGKGVGDLLNSLLGD